MKKVIFLIISCLFFLSMASTSYGQQLPDAANNIETLKQDLNTINGEITNITRLKNSYQRIISEVQKGRSIGEFFTPNDVNKYFGKNPSKQNVIQKLLAFIQEANGKISNLQEDNRKLEQIVKNYENQIWLSRDRETDRINKQLWQEETAHQQKIEETSLRNYKTRENIERVINIVTYWNYWVRPGKAENIYPNSFYSYPYYIPYYPCIFKSK